VAVSATCNATCAVQPDPREEIDPSLVISHHLPLAEAPRGYEMFKHKRDNCAKVVMTP
jgi:threonine dehydrogenase-like Zn-dependent dehydrogenase